MPPAGTDSKHTYAVVAETTEENATRITALKRYFGGPLPATLNPLVSTNKKKRHTMKMLGMLVITSILMTSGCAAFKANDLPTLDSASYSVENQERIKVFSTWRGVERNPLHKGQFDAAIRSSGCCDIVDTAEQADVVIEGVAVNHSTPGAGIPAMITGFTFGVIPSWATLRVHLKATAKDGEQEYTYDVSDSATMVMWLPMLLAMPFSDNPMKVERDIYQNTYRTLVARMKNDGLLTN